MVPELATLRPRLAAVADGSDPLALQRAFAAGMLAADPAGEAVYFVDDHFVPCAGARPVAKGWEGVNLSVVRHEALFVRMEVEHLRLLAVVAVG